MQLKSLDQWLEYIDSVRPTEVDLNLDRIRFIYKKIVKFSSATKVIVVGGTNGKGSTVEFLAQLLIFNKRKVGTFTSPHLFKFNERIKVDGKPISDKMIIDAFEVIEKRRGDTRLTYFDFSTLAALTVFSNLNLDVVILEIGLGGRLDPVNIVDPDISILTNVELDHQEWLGKNREAIGKEKAAIFRDQKTVILGQYDIPKSVIDETLRLKNKVLRIGRDFEYTVNDSLKEWSFSWKKGNQINLDKLQLGSLSVSSLSCGLSAFLALGNKLDVDINEVLERTYLKGRCEIIDNRFLIDVSHNVSSAEYLAAFVKRNFSSDIEITAVLGVMKDKDINSIIKPFKKRVSKWILTSADQQRAMRAEELRTHLEQQLDLNNEAKIFEVEKVNEACILAHQETSIGSLILIFGSFYTVAEAFLAINLLKSVA